jgi:hypothetical protein
VAANDWSQSRCYMRQISLAEPLSCDLSLTRVRSERDWRSEALPLAPFLPLWGPRLPKTPQDPFMKILGRVWLAMALGGAVNIAGKRPFSKSLPGGYHQYRFSRSFTFIVTRGNSSFRCSSPISVGYGRRRLGERQFLCYLTHESAMVTASCMSTCKVECRLVR